MVRRSDQAVVVVRKAHVRDGVRRTYRGCARGGRGWSDLETAFTAAFDGGTSVGYLRASGPFAAYAVSRGTRYESAGQIVVVDLRSGARWASENVGGLSGPGFEDVAVNEHGDAAWVRRVPANMTRAAEARIVLRRDGNVTVRCRSRRELTDLRLTTSRLSWREHGRPRVRVLR